MRYTIKSELHSNVEVVKDNRLDARAYFIPFIDKEKLDASTYLNERYNSDRVQVLSGEWDFIYYGDYRDVPANFEFEELPYAKVNVPCTWQRTGYENPCYLNTRYQFPMKPPIMPQCIPIALYRKQFIVNNTDKKFTLTFLGAASNISLYINGDYVGYAEGAHNMSEFDITGRLNQGNNEILVTVHKWCNGSYLECQDMFRENGIFRDVYITESEITTILDYNVITNKKGNQYDLTVELMISNPMPNSQIAIEVLSNDGTRLAISETVTIEKTVLSFKDLDVKEWNAEQPNLYKMYVTLITPGRSNTIFRSYIGFKKVEIKGEVYYFNGKNIKMKGVNHHDTDAENGWVMSAEQLERDVKLMKEYNCNTIRMSHYPPDPILLSICDHYGLYAVDEADIECHGIYQNPLSRRYGRIPNKLIWKEHFLDRVSNMYYRDRNHACIAMWSLGNEAGGYKCHDYCYNFLKSVTDIPVHYEGVIHTKRHSYDVISQMYPYTDHVIAVGEHSLDNKWKGKPYFLCEYAHAMGVGPGAMSVYMDTFYKYDNIMGGCIWEFVDHAVYHKQGKVKYTYGGDHGETKHDGNFCVDGLFFPDRAPSTGALNMKNVYRPIIAQKVGKNLFQFKNMNSFLNSNYIDCKWQLFVNTVLVGEGVINMNINPMSFIDVKIDCGIDAEDKDKYIIFSYVNKGNGNAIAFEQVVLNTAKYKMKAKSGNQIVVTDNNGTITLLFDKGTLIYDLKRGEIVSYTCNNVEFINQSPHHGVKGLLPNMYRGEIDNDRFIKILWNLIGYNRLNKTFCKAQYINKGNNVIINSKYKLSRYGTIAKVNIRLNIQSNGVIDVTVSAVKGLKMLYYSDIPRFGTTLEMPKEFKNVEYYGMGDKESLSDFNEHTKLGVYNLSVSQMHEPYIMPQESGNRSEVRYAKITDGNSKGLVFMQGDNYLNFNANHFTMAEQLKAKHREELVECDTTNVSIDGFYRGAGTQSCGQGPLPQHKPNMKKPISFNYSIIPTDIIE